ncbi:hypothetical protein CDAR_556671 [Caerostris darwini]|uniref:Uncharacterized protein n=1 Tax=Caerostris darwini TaxID=1538125 RepID=A0AAV4WNU6_9ARAC|nr:hypothetical protein CDAR_556671 [Caerostris darwini]
MLETGHMYGEVSYGCWRCWREVIWTERCDMDVGERSYGWRGVIWRLENGHRDREVSYGCWKEVIWIERCHMDAEERSYGWRGVIWMLERGHIERQESARECCENKGRLREQRIRPSGGMIY